MAADSSCHSRTAGSSSGSLVQLALSYLMLGLHMMVQEEQCCYSYSHCICSAWVVPPSHHRTAAAAVAAAVAGSVGSEAVGEAGWERTVARAHPLKS